MDRENMMLARLRRKYCLLASLCLTGFLLLLALNARPLQPIKPLAGVGEIGFLRRKIAYDDSGGATAADAPTDLRRGSPEEAASSTPVRRPSPPRRTSSVRLTERERKDLAQRGILLVEDDEGVTAGGPPATPRQEGGERPQQPTPEPEGGAQHNQWLKQIELEHEEFIRRQHRLRTQHLLETQILQQKLQEEEEEEKKKRQSPSASVVRKASQTSANLTGTGNGPKTHGRPGALPPPPPFPVTYDALKKQGETILRRTLKREFASVKKDLQFTPGEVVDPRRVRRVIVVSTWRSGSSYLGDLLRAYPGTFFSFEPLHHLLKNQHLQEGPLVPEVVSVLGGIMKCDYSRLGDYVDYVRNNTFLIDRNIRLWNSCARNRALCFDPEYLSRLCKYMPVNVAKTVRMGLSPVLELLRDPSLDLRVIHLVRDPRGTLHSRQQLSWCVSQVCSDPATVCKDLLADLTLSDWMKQNFPKRYLLVRYEDMGLHPEEKARDIFKFLQLSYNKYVASFVKEHTTPSRKIKKNNKYSTYRDSKATTFAWRGALNYTAVEAIQDVCEEPLRKLRLRIFLGEEDYLNATLPVLLDD